MAEPYATMTEDEAPISKDQAEKEKVCKAWHDRINAGIKQQTPWWEAGRKRKKFIEGSQWNEQQDIQLPNGLWSKTTANRMHSLVNGYMAATVYRRPNVNAKPPRAGEKEQKKAIVDQAYLNYCLREGQYERHQRLSQYDAIVYGAGFREHRLDKERGGIAKTEWRSAEDVVVDPHANTVESSCSWMAIRFTMNVRTARRIYKCPELKADSQSGKDKPNSTGSNKNSSSHVGGGMEDERVTLWRVWARGDDPAEDENEPEANEQTEKDEGTEPPKGANEDTNQSVLEKYLSKHGNRRVIVCMHHKTVLEDAPWPFVLDHDAFPVTCVRLHDVPGQFLPYSPLQPVEELQRQLNWAMTFMITQMRRTSQRKYVVNKEAFTGIGKEEIQKLLTLESEEIIEANGQLDRAIQPVDFGALSAAPIQMFQLLEDQFDTISGYREMYGGMEGARSATEASIREERAQTLSDLMRQATEAAANEDLRKMLQISFSATPAATVVNVVGQDVMEVSVDQLTGQPIQVVAYWDENMTPEQIRSEVDVVLEPGSMRRVNRDQEVTDLINVMDRVIGIVGQYPSLGMQPNPEALLTWQNSVLRKLYEAMGWVDGVHYLIKPEMVGLMPQPEGNQTLQIDQSTHMTEGNQTLHEAAPTNTLHEASPSLSLSFKEGNKQPIDRAKSSSGGLQAS